MKVFFSFSFVIVLLASLLLCTQGLYFRTINGRGNARRNRGSAGSPFRRLRRRANYRDGRSQPHNGVSARLISNTILSSRRVHNVSHNLNDLFWNWGQFLDHDMTATQSSSTEYFNIPVPPNDKTFKPGSSLPFKRSKGRIVRGIRQQINDVTAFIDGSQVYGSDDRFARSLRETDGRGYRLIESRGRNLKWSHARRNFVGGDHRAGEQPGLTMLHTIFLREHNRLADLIARSLPTAHNETIYHRARLLVGSELQLITYQEFLPKLLGFKLPIKKLKYDRSRNPGIYNEFATTCFRFGHTMVPDHLSIRDRNFCKPRKIPLAKAFFNPEIILRQGSARIIQGLVSQRAQGLDRFFVDTLRNFLFQNERGDPSSGMDLAALNIQRARDHGLPDYCDIHRIRRDGSLRYTDIVSDAALAKELSQLYGPDPCKIDLFVAGLVEDARGPSLLGKTCTKIIGAQFRNVAEGDAFFLTNINWRAYGLDQDPAIDGRGTRLSKVTLSRILELNSVVRNLPADVMSLSDKFKCTH